MHQPHVYVITPTYRREDDLLRMLSSVNHQDYQGKITVLICHDGPNKDLRELLDSSDIRKYLSDIEYKYYEIEHEGLVGGRPRKYLIDNHLPDDGYTVFIDDDNVVYPNYVSKMVELTADDSDMAMCRIEHHRFDRIIPDKKRLGSVEFEHIDSLNVIIRTSIVKKHSDRWIQKPNAPIDHDYLFIKACFEDANRCNTTTDLLGIHSVNDGPWQAFTFAYAQYPFLYTEIFPWNCYSLQEEDIEGRHVIDIGASNGMFAYFANRFHPKSITVVEPSPVEKTSLSMLHYYGIKVKWVFAAAVSEQGKKDDLYLEVKENGVESHLTEKDTGYRPKKVTLEELIKDIPEGDEILLKLDCEGSEYDILLNSKPETLLRFSVITLEAHPKALTGLPHTPDDLIRYICPLGFNLENNGLFYGEGVSEKDSNRALRFTRTDAAVKTYMKKDKDIEVAVKTLKRDVTAYVCTRGRYFSTLPISLNSIIHQTIKPKDLVIYDDTPPDDRVDMRDYSVYSHLFALCDKFGIEWSVIFGDGKGQVKGHNLIKSNAKTGLLWRVDDDCHVPPDALAKLLDIFDDNTGAVAPCIVDPTNDPGKMPEGVTGKIENVRTEPNMQWFVHEGSGILYPEHLYSSFLYRQDAPVKFNETLSPVGHREETIFTHNLFRKGYDLKIHTGVVLWHYRESRGGIRSFDEAKLWEHDEKVFNQEMNRWGVEQPTVKYVHLDCGYGDHYAFLNVLPDILRKYKHVVIACMSPEIFRDYAGDHVELISIQEGKNRYGEDYCDNKLNVYAFMTENKWEGNLVSAFRALYLGSPIAPTIDHQTLFQPQDEDGDTIQRPFNTVMDSGLRKFASWLGPDKDVVEVGTFTGESALIFSTNVGHVTTIDNWVAGDHIRKKAEKRLRNIPNVKMVSGDSSEVAKTYKDNSIDCVYIDAAHDYDSVIRDIRAWLPKVKYGGIISGHDYSSPPEYADHIVKAILDVFGSPDRVYDDSTWMVVKPWPKTAFRGVTVQEIRQYQADTWHEMVNLGGIVL